jgi:small-conductance mechanosensitive channel
LSFGLLLAIVAVLLLARFLVSRYVEDPDQRYAANRALSIVTTFVLLFGLAIIFLRQFPHLITGLGVVLAGVAIALQEVILSFFGFFAIRGARGYRVGDWVRIGDYYGEVVDIGLLVTILEEVTPIEFTGHRGGVKTGALIWVNNNAIFREKMTNYTRGFPYIWCTLSYTITFESDWQRAVELLHEIVDNHDEIQTTAKLAHKKAAEAASDFAIKVENTQPRVRTWTADSGVELRLRFMAHPRRRRALIDAVNREVMTAVAATDGVEFAYTTMRVIPTPEVDEIA